MNIFWGKDELDVVYSIEGTEAPVTVLLMLLVPHYLAQIVSVFVCQKWTVNVVFLERLFNIYFVIIPYP
jgi:hypothetical protein